MKRYKAADVFPLPRFKTERQQGGIVASVGRPAPVVRYQESPRTTGIYAAELEVRRIMRNPAELAPNGHLFPVELRWNEVEQAQGYVNIVLSWPWDRWRTGPAWPCSVQWDEHPTPHYRSGVVYMPKVAPWNLRELVVLHELGHHFTQGQEHGLAWVQAWIDLVGTAMSPIVAQLIRTHLNANGIAT